MLSRTSSFSIQAQTVQHMVERERQLLSREYFGARAVPDVERATAGNLGRQLPPYAMVFLSLSKNLLTTSSAHLLEKVSSHDYTGAIEKV